MKSCSSYSTSQQKWDAVRTRDKKAEGCFFFGVITTGIFCRPGCSARLPRRENVLFFADADAALAAGFRPCKKCSPTGITARQAITQKIVAACRIIEHSDTPPKLAELARMAGLSSYYFQRTFKELTGVTPKQYGTQIRSGRLKSYLQAGLPVAESIYGAGFSSVSGVYNKEKDQLAMTPKQYKAGGAGVTIHYGVACCSLGWTVVAATQRGICAIAFDSNKEMLPKLVAEKFPQATIREAGPEFSECIEKVVHFIENPKTTCDLPLDIQGTAFQQRVWDILRQIKPGETLSYSQVAKKLGNPKAVRAVATACAANKLAVIIPCHRVIGKNGTLTGYRWGLERKQQLLEKETD